MEKVTMMRNCSSCLKEFDWVEQILEWCKEYGTDWVSFAMVMVRCPHCGEYAGEIDLMEGEMEEELVESPALEAPVRVPTGLKKDDKVVN